MKSEQKLYTYRAKYVIIEKQRLSQWAYQFNYHNQAFFEGLSACKQHLVEVKSSPFFADLDRDLQFDILRQISTTEQLIKQVNELKQEAKPTFPPVTYQVPTADAILAMRGMCAGGKQDQLARLHKLVKTMRTQLVEPQITETLCVVSHYWIDRLPWQVLCQAIRSQDAELAKVAFESIPSDNLVLKALLKVHDKTYLLSLIKFCAKLSPNKIEEMDTDIYCRHLTFEVLIYDLLTTLEQRQQFNLCLGLPTHHAYRDQGAGFCLINKIAVVMAYEEMTAAAPFHAVIIGTDVNRDDGLNSILMANETTQAFTHMDIYDSRVYPWHDEKELRKRLGKPLEESAIVWQKENKCYHSVDLATHTRKRKGGHAALYYALSELERLLMNAAQKKVKIMLFLPSGWDSHEEEEAPCGKEINQERELNAKESHSHRFNDDDYRFFNQKIVDLCGQYPDTLCRIYWQLEGGYTENVNVRQLKNMINLLKEYYPLVEEKESLENSKAMAC